jgi:hypothetical protein
MHIRVLMTEPCSHPKPMAAPKHRSRPREMKCSQATAARVNQVHLADIQTSGLGRVRRPRPYRPQSRRKHSSLHGKQEHDAIAVRQTVEQGPILGQGAFDHPHLASRREFQAPIQPDMNAFVFARSRRAGNLRGTGAGSDPLSTRLATRNVDRMERHRRVAI